MFKSNNSKNDEKSQIRETFKHFKELRISKKLKSHSKQIDSIITQTSNPSSKLSLSLISTGGVDTELNQCDTN